jgi:hypothetical protein
MRPRDLFEVAIRIVGVLVVLVNLPAFVSALVEWLYLHPQPAGTPEAYGINAPPNSYVEMIFSDVISLSVGLLLLFGGRVVAHVIYGRDKSN